MELKNVGLQMRFVRGGPIGKRCMERMLLVKDGKIRDEVLYLRVQILNSGSTPAKGCIGKCEVWNKTRTELKAPKERLAWQPRTAHNAVEPIDILPSDHEFLVIAWSQSDWNGKFTFATRKAYISHVPLLDPGTYSIRVEVLSENAGYVRQWFTLQKMAPWEIFSLKPSGKQEVGGLEQKIISGVPIETHGLSETSVFEHLVANAYRKMGYEVQVAKQSRDWGVDAIAEKDSHKLFIEVKYYKKPVGVVIVREVMGAFIAHRTTRSRSVIVSSSGFTELARKTAEKLGVELVDASDLFTQVNLESDDIDFSRIISAVTECDAVEEVRDTMLNQKCQAVRNAPGRIVKGRALEDFTAYVIDANPGLEVVQRNSRTGLEEIDLIVANEASDYFLPQLGNPLLVECKNWSSKVSVPDLRVFGSKMESKSVRTGIILSTGGYTRGHKQLIREQRQFARIIIPLYGSDFDLLCDGTSFTDIVRERFYESYEW